MNLITKLSVAPHEQAAQPWNSGWWKWSCTTQDGCSHPPPASWVHLVPGEHTVGTGELQCGTELGLPAQSSLCVKHLMLLNNRVGLPVLAKLASCNRDDDIFAFGIFCFCTTSNFPPWCQERFLSTSPGRSQIRTPVLYLCYLYKKVSLPTAFILFTKGNVELNRIYIKVSSDSFTFSAVLSLGICLRGGPNQKGTLLFSLYCTLTYKKFTREMMWKQPTLLPWLKFLDLERLPLVRVICKSHFAPRKCM